LGGFQLKEIKNEDGVLVDHWLALGSHQKAESPRLMVMPHH